MKLSDLHGTYVALESDIKLHDEKLHVTLMYSKKRVNPQLVYEILSDLKFPMTINLGGPRVLSVHCSDGSISTTSGMLTLLCNDSRLYEIHERLKSIGLVHTYENYTPHVSLKKVPIDHKPTSITKNSLELVRLIVEPIRTNSR